LLSELPNRETVLQRLQGAGECIKLAESTALHLRALRS